MKTIDWVEDETGEPRRTVCEARGHDMVFDGYLEPEDDPTIPAGAILDMMPPVMLFRCRRCVKVERQEIPEEADTSELGDLLRARREREDVA